MAVNYNIPLQTQLEYMMQELQGPESATLDAFGSGTAISPQDYAEMFEQKYERSGGEGMGKRRQYALEIFTAADKGELENLPDNVQTAFNFFKRQGFTDPQAAGIVGNLQVESFPMINPQAYNPEGGGMGAYGIAQFRGPRLKGLLQYAGKQGENTMDGNVPFGMPLRATMKQDMPQQRGGMMGGIRGLLDYGGQINPQTGLSRFETFAAALDPLIMPTMRGGEGIRARGAQRVQAGNLNKTIEWLKANGYEDIATMVAQNPQTASNVMSAILSKKLTPQKQGKVVTAEQLRTMFPGEQIADGLYNLSEGPDGMKISKIGGAGTTIQMPGATPSEDELRKELMRRQGKDFGAYLDAGSAASQAMTDLNILQQIAPLSPSGPLAGRLAEAFPEFSDVATLRQSIVQRVAPTLRVEGSGSTSDIEFNAMLNSLGSLRNTPEANQAIIAVMMEKQQFNLDRANIVRQYQTGRIDLKSANDQIAALETQSRIPAQVQSIIDSYIVDGASTVSPSPKVRTYNPETGEFE
jgi:hypothetical protein